MPFSRFKEEEIEPNEPGSVMMNFNNFFCHFIINDGGSLGAYRKSIYDETEEGFIRIYPDLSGDRETSVMINHAKFYKDLDASVLESGNTNEKIRKLITDWRQSHKGGAANKLLFDALAPVYKAMRNKGYPHGRLCQ